MLVQRSNDDAFLRIVFAQFEHFLQWILGAPFCIHLIGQQAAHLLQPGSVYVGKLLGIVVVSFKSKSIGFIFVSRAEFSTVLFLVAGANKFVIGEQHFCWGE